MHLNSELLFRKYAKPYFKRGMKVLEIGPDGVPSRFRKIVEDETVAWETLDVHKRMDLTYISADEYKFPVKDNTFDIVLSGQVIEHVRKIWVWIKELSRVCKMGGHVITIAPASWPYHESPVDCWRIYPEGMKALYEEAGLKVDVCKFESLEKPVFGRAAPGEGAVNGPRKTSVKSIIKFHTNQSRPYSIDTIAIGTKVITVGNPAR